MYKTNTVNASIASRNPMPKVAAFTQQSRDKTITVVKFSCKFHPLNSKEALKPHASFFIGRVDQNTN